MELFPLGEKMLNRDWIPMFTIFTLVACLFMAVFGGIAWGLSRDRTEKMSWIRLLLIVTTSGLSLLCGLIALIAGTCASPMKS